MIILSFNIRGISNTPKRVSFKRVLEKVGSNIVLLQETMSSSHPALLAFSKIHPGWEYCALSSSGLLGGLLATWNPRCFKIKAFITMAGILLKVQVRGSSMNLSLLNSYGPYSNRESFWNLAAQGGFLSQPNLVLSGDLNLTLSSNEFWGRKARPDPLAPFF